MLKFIALVLLFVSLGAATIHLPGYHLNPFSAVHYDRTNKNLYLGNPQIYSLGPKPIGGCRVLQRILSDVNGTSFTFLHPNNSYDRLVVSNNYAQTNKHTYPANHLHQQLFYKNGSLFECDSRTSKLSFGFRYIVPSQNSTNTIYAIVSSCPNNNTYNRIIKVNLDTMQFSNIYKSNCTIYNLKLWNNRLYFIEDSFTCAKSSGFVNNGINSINVDSTGLSKSLSWAPADFDVTTGTAVLFNTIGIYTCTITNQFNFTNCHKIISYSQYPIYTGAIGDNNTIYYLESEYNNCSLLYSATLNGTNIQPVIKNGASYCKFGANMTFSAFNICQRDDNPAFCNSLPPSPSPSKSSCIISIPILLIVGFVLALLICKCVLLCRSRRRCRMARQYAMVNTVAPARVDVERIPLTQDTDPAPTYPIATNMAIPVPSYPSYPQPYVQAIPVPSAPVILVAPPRTSYQPVYATPTIILVDNEEY